MEANYLDTLTATELLFLQKHLKLGLDHLKEQLEDKEIKEILDLGYLDPETKEEILEDKEELTGKLALTFNSVLSAILGGWIGFSAFIGLKFSSVSLCFTIVSLSAILGAWAGYHTVLQTKKAARQALEKRRMQKVEILVLKRLQRKRKEEIAISKNELKSTLNELNLPPEEALSSDFPENGIRWLDQVLNEVNKTAELQDKQSYQALLGEIIAARAALFKNLDLNEKKKKAELTPILKKLAGSPVRPITLHFWVKKHLRAVLLSSIPAVMSGLSSLLVYFNGIPRIAKELGKESIWLLYSKPETKMIELIISFFITGFFAYSFFHINYKKFLRDANITNADSHIVEMENAISLLDDELLGLKSLQACMAQIAQAMSLSQ